MLCFRLCLILILFIFLTKIMWFYHRVTLNKNKIELFSIVQILGSVRYRLVHVPSICPKYTYGTFYSKVNRASLKSW